MTGVCVLLFARAPRQAGTVEEAYHTISQRLRDTPGLKSNTLLELVDDPGRFVVLSEWTSLEAFRAWEQGPDHRDQTAPLRPYQDRTAADWFGVYRIAAAYR
jgi:heme-degrading monooxygenase HmoA